MFIGIHIYLKIIPMGLIGVADQFLQIKLYSLNVTGIDYNALGDVGMGKSTITRVFISHIYI